LYPKHKEEMPNKKLNIKNTHSNISVTINERLKIGINKKINGINVQCIEHINEALKPILSNLFLYSIQYIELVWLLKFGVFSLIMLI
jgi:hypothetical protein